MTKWTVSDAEHVAPDVEVVQVAPPLKAYLLNRRDGKTIAAYYNGRDWEAGKHKDSMKHFQSLDAAIHNFLFDL